VVSAIVFPSDREGRGRDERSHFGGHGSGTRKSLKLAGCGRRGEKGRGRQSGNRPITGRNQVAIHTASGVTPLITLRVSEKLSFS
jgi:hypothetical protein